MLENEYDVIVVGAGPGGSAVAKKCAEAGLKVAVFEKRYAIGLKCCGEGLSADSLNAMGQEVPKSCIAQTIDGAIVCAPNGKKVVIDYGRTGGYIVERKFYDKWLAEEAARAGAYIQTKTFITDVIKKNDFICGVRGEQDGERFTINSRVVVAADGVESVIARKAGLDTTNKLSNIDSGFQYEMVGIELEDPHKIILYFGNEIAPRGYVWVFPKGEDKANVGIGVALTEKPAKYYLDKFIASRQELKKGSILEVNSGGIPVGGFLKNMTLNGFVAVGDAAHQVNPIHGGGMKEAAIAGKMAGEVIAECIKEGDSSQKALSKYNDIWWKERGHKLEKVQKLREVIEKLSDDDYNLLAEQLTGEDLIEFTRGNRLAKLAKILIKRPKLAALARHLL